MIMRCFRIGNCKFVFLSSLTRFLDTSLRDMPNKLAPNQIIKFNKKRIENTLQVREPQPQRKLFGGGLFGEFEWMPDAYDNCNQFSYN